MSLPQQHHLCKTFALTAAAHTATRTTTFEATSATSTASKATEQLRTCFPKEKSSNIDQLLQYVNNYERDVKVNREPGFLENIAIYLWCI